MPTNIISRTSCSIYPINHPTLPNGLPAQEYKHHALKSTFTGAIQEIVTIESNEGSAFEVKVDINPSAYSLLHRSPDPSTQDDYLIYVYLDGIKIQRSKRHRSQVGPTIISGVYSTDRKSTRLFQFGKLHLVDPDDNNRFCQDEKIIQALGTIQINIVKCTLLEPRPALNNNNSKQNSHLKPSSPSHHSHQRNPESLQTTNQMIFSERSKKACQFTTAGLGKPVPARNNLQAKKKIRPVRNEDANPFLQFIFKYKPRSILEAEGTISPPPPPPPSPPPSIPRSSTNKPGQSFVKKDASSNQKVRPKNGQQDKKEPNLGAAERNYIVVESDSETECSEAETKKKVTRATTSRLSRSNNGNDNKSVSGMSGYGTTNVRASKLENDGENENRPQLIDHLSSNEQKTSESKKRIRSSTTIEDEPTKRRSSITPGNIDRETSSFFNRGLDNKPNSQSVKVIDTTVRDNQTNYVYDDSSDDDNIFHDRNVSFARSSGSKHDFKHPQDLKPSQIEKADVYEAKIKEKGFNTDNNSVKTTAITPNGRYVVKNVWENGHQSNFVDLTELDSD